MNKRFIIVAILAASLFSCTKNPLAETTQEPLAEDGEVSVKASIAHKFQSGRAVVKFDDSMLAIIEQDIASGSLATKSSALNSAIADLGIVSMRRVFPDAGEFEERTRREGLHRYYMVEFGRDVATTKAVDELEAIPGILKAEGVMRVRRRSFNDPYLSRQWHLVNTGSRTNFKAGADIGAEAVWQNYTTGNEKVIVAVVDGGIALAHTDLAANAVPAGANGSRNFVKNNYTIEIDDHGTHVAGTIAAINNNGVGVSSVAGGDYANGVKGCKVMSCQIFNDDDYDENNGSDETCANAIKWGADHGALISQNSWGYYADDNDDGYVSQKEYNDLKAVVVPSVIKEAINYFVKYAGCDNQGNQKSDSMMKGGIVFFAAGNEDIDIDPICQQCDVVAVGSFGPDGNKAYYSNYGDWVDIAAPGGNGMLSGGQVYSLAPNNRYAYMQGTSMACPHASGVAALVISAKGGQGFTNTELKTRLLKGKATSSILATNIGHKLDAAGAVTYSSINRPPVISVVNGSVTTAKAWQTIDIPLVVSDPDGDALTVTITDSGSAAEQIVNTEGEYALRITAPAAAAGTYSCEVTVEDQNGASASVTVVYTILENNPPVLNKNFSNIISSEVGQIFSFNINEYITDPDEEPLSCTVVVDNNTIAHGNISSDNTLYVTSLSYGIATITVKAVDALGKTVSTEFYMLVRDGDSDGIDVYPNPVRTNLNIRTGLNDAQTKVRLVSATGSVVYDQTRTFSAFNPLQINMADCAPGVYNLEVTFDNVTHKKTILKK